MQSALGLYHSQSLVKAVTASGEVFFGSLLTVVQVEPNIKKIMRNPFVRSEEVNDLGVEIFISC